MDETRTVCTIPTRYAERCWSTDGERRTEGDRRERKGGKTSREQMLSKLNKPLEESQQATNKKMSTPERRTKLDSSENDTNGSSSNKENESPTSQYSCKAATANKASAGDEAIEASATTKVRNALPRAIGSLCFVPINEEF